MTLSQLAAIRAIVAVAHPHHHLLTAIDAELDRLRVEEDRCQTEVTTVKVSSPERPESTTNGVDWTQSHKDRRAPHLALTRPGPWPTGLEST